MTTVNLNVPVEFDEAVLVKNTLRYNSTIDMGSTDVDLAHKKYVDDAVEEKLEKYDATQGDKDSGTDHIMLLCPADNVQNVLGTLWIQRTSGHKQLTKIDILYGTGSTHTNREAQLQVTQAEYNPGTFTIEIFDVEGTDYVGLRRQGARYFNTDAWFIGKSSYTGSLFCRWYATPGGTTEIPMNGRVDIGPYLAWHTGDFSSADISNWDTAYDRSVTGVSGDGNSTLTITRQGTNVTTNLSHTHATLSTGDGLSGSNYNGSTAREFSVDSSVVRTSEAQSIAGNKTFTDTIIGNDTNGVRVRRGFTGGYGSTSGSGGDWGANIWSIGDNWSGSGHGSSYSISGGSSSQYGLSWLRASHTSALAAAGEGLYIYRAGTRIVALGHTGNYLANDLGIGQTSPSYALDVDGTIRATGDVIANSDIRLKENIQEIPDALQKIKQLRGVTYNRKDLKGNPRQTGVIAQEVQKVLPEAVHEEKTNDKKLSVAYGNMIGLLIQAIKEQQKQITDLQKQLNTN